MCPGCEAVPETSLSETHCEGQRKEKQLKPDNPSFVLNGETIVPSDEILLGSLSSL